MLDDLPTCERFIYYTSQNEFGGRAWRGHAQGVLGSHPTGGHRHEEGLGEARRDITDIEWDGTVGRSSIVEV